MHQYLKKNKPSDFTILINLRQGAKSYEFIVGLTGGIRKSRYLPIYLLRREKSQNHNTMNNLLIAK